MATTALNIITRAMRKAGILSNVESPTSDEANDALDTMNDIIASLSNDGLLVYAHTTESFSITGGTGSYTIGSGGDFNTSRPLSILSAYCRDSSGTDSTVGQIGQAEYAKLATKTTQGRPKYFYYDNDYSLGTLNLYPVPDTSYTFYITSEKPITSFSSLTTSFDMPPGWALLLTDALAISLAPEYGVQTPQETILSYERSVTALKRQKARMTNMDSNRPASGNNIYTGFYG